MGREVKRVALNFEWPLNVVWKGYLNPYDAIKCEICGGSGLNAKTKELKDSWYTDYSIPGNVGWGKNIDQEDVQALIDADRLWDFTRVPLNDEHKEIIKENVAKGENNWLPFNNGYVPTAKEVNKWNKKGMGHCSLNQWTCVKAKAKRLGFYGDCMFCEGKGYYWCDDKYEKLSNDWECIEPPKGEGYQMWETTSEGSPTSPVCKTPEELAKWLFENKASTFGPETTSYETWLSMIKIGIAPSMVQDEKGLRSGVEACNKHKSL